MKPKYSRLRDRSGSFGELEFLAQKKSLKFVSARSKYKNWKWLGGLLLEDHEIGEENLAIAVNKEKDYKYHRYENRITTLNPMKEFLITKRSW